MVMLDFREGDNLRGSRIVPERIREAREAKGLSAEQLADEIGVSRQAIGQYEVGQAAPSPQVMSRIIGITGQPPNFFTSARAKNSENAGTAFWRSLKRMQRSDRLRVSRRLEWAWDIAAFLEQFIDLPPVNIPNVEWDYAIVNDGQIEAAARKLREHWQIGSGPIRHIVAQLEANGVIIVREHVKCEDMDAVSRWQGGRPFMLTSSDKDSGPRTAFDVAHELGHLLLHSNVELNKDNLAKVERQANYFAGAFLLPQETFAKEVVSTSVDYFVMLKERWGVSVQAMVYRCKELGILNENQVGYLWRQINARDMRAREPLDDVFAPESPTVLASAMRMLVDHGVQTREQICEALCFNRADLESLCGLPSGFFDQTVVQLKLHRRQT